MLHSDEWREIEHRSPKRWQKDPNTRICKSEGKVLWWAKILNKMTKEDVPEKITLKERCKTIRRLTCAASFRKQSTDKEKLAQVSEGLTSKFSNLWPQHSHLYCAFSCAKISGIHSTTASMSWARLHLGLFGSKGLSEMSSGLFPRNSWSCMRQVEGISLLQVGEGKACLLFVPEVPLNSML